MTVERYYRNGMLCELTDEALVLPEGATEQDYSNAWQAMAELEAYWLFYPDA